MTNAFDDKNKMMNGINTNNARWWIAWSMKRGVWVWVVEEKKTL